MIFKRKNLYNQEFIEKLVKSPDWRERLKAADIIANNLSDKNINLLLNLLGDPDWSVSKEVEDLFIRMSGVGRDYLLKYGIKNKKDIIRRKSYNILIKMGYKEDAVIRLAGFYEDSGDYEKAAEMYEKIGDITKANELRKREKEKYIYQKTINIDINLESLFEYIKLHGLVVKYKCPSCGANIEIDGKHKIYYCPYCGTKIEAIDIKKLLENLLK